MVNFGPLAAEIVSLVWGTQANFTGFRGLVPLLHGTLVVGCSVRSDLPVKRDPENATWVPAKLCGVEQRAPPIFCRAAIKLGIGSHSSC